MNALAATLSTLFLSVLGQHVNFEPGTHDIDEKISDVDHMAEWIGTYAADTPVMVTGYACEEDKLLNTTEDDLLELADARAIKLRQELILRGIDATRISTIAYGLMSSPGVWYCQATARVDPD